MSINIKETHLVNPTKPTQHLPIVLTNNDLVLPKMYILIHYFFKNVDNGNKFMDIQELRTSLEDILSDYYPLVGQLKMEPEGRMSIVCSDKGIPFIVAESHDITIKQFEDKNWANSSVPNGLLPVAFMPNSIDAPLFAVQHTTLADGSVVLGMAMHHSVADGYGFFTFLENWGLKTRQKPFTPPIHDRNLLKASGNPSIQEHNEYIAIDPKLAPNIPTKLPPMDKKIFYFSKENLKKLRDDYSSKNSNDPWISTNDALVAHLWRTATRARGVPLEKEVICAFALDGRKRLNPPLPLSYFGNIVLGGFPKILVSELVNGDRPNLALKVRKTVEEVNDLRIRDTIDWIEQHPNKHVIMPNYKSFCGMDFAITSWAKFPMYDLDFGYGTPIKCRLQNFSQLDGLAAIIETPPEDDGLEIYISLITEHMQKLEQDPEFQMYL